MTQTQAEEQPANAENGQNSSEQASEPPLPEKLIGVVGLLLLLAIIGFLLYEGWIGDEPPVLTVQPTAVLHNEAGYLLQIELINSGSQTAAEVQIEGELFHNDSAAPPVETSETIFDYAPPHSTRHGALIFQQDPADYKLDLHVKSYTEP